MESEKVYHGLVSVASSGFLNCVLLQTQDDHGSARVVMSKPETEKLIKLLNNELTSLKSSDKVNIELRT